MLLNVPYYQDELENNAFAYGASALTTVVKDITGREPEDFETIARRSFKNSPEMKLTLGNKLRTFKSFMKMMFAKEPSINKIKSKYGHPTSNTSYKYVQEDTLWENSH